jgi:hypothetical protein
VTTQLQLINIIIIIIIIIINIVAGIVQIFIKSWNQLLYPRVIEVCRLTFELRHDFFLHLTGFRSVVKKRLFHFHSQWSQETHLLPVRSA